MSGTATITLKDGSKVLETVLITTFKNLEEARKKGVLFDLVDKCNDASHQIYNPLVNAKKILEELGLMDNSGRIYDYVKQVVANCVVVKGPELELVNPLK